MGSPPARELTSAASKLWGNRQAKNNRPELIKALLAATQEQIRDFEYLIHHIEIEGGKDVVHHCNLYDHIGNLFAQGQLVVKNGSVSLDGKKVSQGMFHVLVGLEPTQEVCWSDEEAIEAGITPKKMVDGMTRKEKAKVW